MLIHYAPIIPLGDDGTVSYTTRYAQSGSGYRGRVYAQGVDLPKAPSRLRNISYAEWAAGDGASRWRILRSIRRFSIRYA